MSDVPPVKSNHSIPVEALLQNSPADKDVPDDVIQRFNESKIIFHAENKHYHNEDFLIIFDNYNNHPIFFARTNPHLDRISYVNNRFWEKMFPQYKPTSQDIDYINTYIKYPESISRAKAWLTETTSRHPWELFNFWNIYGTYQGDIVPLGYLLPLKDNRRFSTFFSTPTHDIPKDLRSHSLLTRYKIDIQRFKSHTLNGNYYSLPDFFWMNMPPVLKTLTEAAIHTGQSITPAVKKAAGNLALRAATSAIASYAGLGESVSWAFSTLVDYGFNYLYNRYHLDPFQDQVYHLLNAWNYQFLKQRQCCG